MDGTFLLAPPHFAQIFVILARKSVDFVTPILFALLPDKSQITYERLFQLIHQALPNLNPSIINCDYEQTIHSAIRNSAFNQAEIHGCFFHLVQNLRKHLSEAGLLGLYQTDPEFSLKVCYFY